MYEAYTSLDKLKVMSKKFTVWWLISAVVLRLWALKISCISFLILSTLFALLLCMIAKPSSWYKPTCLLPNHFLQGREIRRYQLDYWSLRHLNPTSWRRTWTCCSSWRRTWNCCSFYPGGAAVKNEWFTSMVGDGYLLIGYRCYFFAHLITFSKSSSEFWIWLEVFILMF